MQQVWDRLEEEKSELEASQHELEEEQSYMEELLEEKKQEYENYNVQIARAKQEAAAYRTRIKQQTAQIKNTVCQTRSACYIRIANKLTGIRSNRLPGCTSAGSYIGASSG